MHLQAVLPGAADPRPAQGINDPVAHLIEHRHRRHRIPAFTKPAINNHPGAALLPAPRLAGNQRVSKKSLRPGDTADMALHFTQPGVGKRRALCMWFDISAQPVQVRVSVVLVLAEELHDPGIHVMFIKAVLKCILNRVPDLFQALFGSPFGRHRCHIINGPHRHAVIEQETLLFIEKFCPGQKVNDGRIGVINLLLILARHFPGALQRLPALHGRGQGFICLNGLAVINRRLPVGGFITRKQ